MSTFVLFLSLLFQKSFWTSLNTLFQVQYLFLCQSKSCGPTVIFYIFWIKHISCDVKLMFYNCVRLLLWTYSLSHWYVAFHSQISFLYFLAFLLFVIVLRLNSVSTLEETDVKCVHSYIMQVIFLYAYSWQHDYR